MGKNRRGGKKRMKGRGRERLVRCDACGRLVPRGKAVKVIKGMRFDTGEQKDIIIDLTAKEVYYCISCAKHRGIFEKKKKQAQRRREEI